MVFGLAWSQRQEERYRFRLALGSFIEEYTNKVQIVQRNNESGSLERVLLQLALDKGEKRVLCTTGACLWCAARHTRTRILTQHT